MPAKNPGYYAQAAKTAHQPIIIARIDRMVSSDRTHIKAIATINLGGAFAVHGLKVIDSQKGLFVQMPQTSTSKDGKVSYQDIFHPVSAEARTELNARVLEAYRQKLSEDVNQAQAPPEEYPLLKEPDPDDPFAGEEDNLPFDMGM